MIDRLDNQIGQLVNRQIDRRSANRRSQILTVSYLAFLLFLVATSTPRRVGDGGEYMAMAMNLAALRPPALSTSDLHRIERRLAEIRAGYEVVPLEMPSLGGRDGRQDFPHFWLYPLLTVPALWIVDGLHVHPNDAFTITNILIATGAFLILVRRGTPPLAVLVLAGPVIWWIDKAHGEILTVSLLAIGFALARSDPGWALVAVGAATAQNPPLAPVFVLCAIAIAVHAKKGSGMIFGRRTAKIIPDPFFGAAGVALAALPFLYYDWRLGVPTPIVAWTKPHVPRLREAGAFLWDPNIGLAVNDPIFVAVIAVIASAALARRQIGLGNLLPLACAAALVVGFTQSVNINHGATPGINRWTLWLMPLAAPLIVDAQRDGRPARWLYAAAIASTIWSVVWFHPARGEDYKTPTRLAQWIWSRAPWIDNPPVEIFAERVSRSEPPAVPVATADCRKVLVIDGEWPVPCLPPLEIDAACATPASACYANADASRYTFTRVRFPAGLDMRRARAWPLDSAFARHLRDALDGLGAQGLVPAPAGRDGAMLRAAHAVPWTYSLQAPDRVFVYVADPARDAVLTLRLPGPMAGEFVDLDTGRRIIGVIRGGGEGWSAWDVKVPPGPRRQVLLLKATAAR